MSPEEMLAHLAEVGTPPGGDADVIKVSAGLQQTLERVAREDLPFVAAGGGGLQFVFGPNGRGKTHFLRAVSQWAREHGFVTAYVDCQDNLSPFRELQQTYRAIADRMEPPDGLQTQPFFGVSGVARVIEAQFIGRNDAARREVVERLRDDRALAPDFRNLVLAYCTAAVLDGGDEELSERLGALLAATSTYRVTLGELYRAHRNLQRPLGKLGRRNAAIWLRALLSLPRVLGYPGLLVLFDETETGSRGRIQSVSAYLRGRSRQLQRHLAHVRTFIDHMATGAFRGCGVYYAVTEEFIVDARAHLAALSQRIERVRLSETRNPRAVWVDLDELTVPGPREPAFFEELAGRIVGIGREAGLPAADEDRIQRELGALAVSYALDNINEGAVRDFVKEAATRVAQELSS